MSFCHTCGEPEAAAAACTRSDCPSKALAPLPATKIELPPANMARRLGGSGLELVTLFLVDIAGGFLSFGSAFIAGICSSVLVGGYVLCKDMGGGTFSFGKLISQTRVVDATTGQAATTVQCVGRNVSYSALWLLSGIPFFDFGAWPLILLHVVVDVLMIVANPRGRRLGDFIVGTQVVPVKG